MNVGTPLPENEPGIACPLCFGDGKPLGPTPPKFVYLTFAGVKPGPGFGDVVQGQLPNGRWLLENDQGCRYFVHYPLWNITLLWGVSTTLVRWRDASDAILFNTIFPSAICKTSVNNAVHFGPFIAAYDGHCDITWSEDGL